MEGGGTELSKLDLAQEAEALRRVVSAYLNYSSAAEEDILRWEKSYSKLSPDHKALVKHLPKKYSNLRRCVQANSYFIKHALQAFAPPFDMPQFAPATDAKYHNCSNANYGTPECSTDLLETGQGKARDLSHDEYVGGGSVYSSFPFTTDNERKPPHSHHCDDRPDSRTSNKRRATESSFDVRTPSDQFCVSSGDSSQPMENSAQITNKDCHPCSGSRGLDSRCAEHGYKRLESSYGGSTEEIIFGRGPAGVGRSSAGTTLEENLDPGLEDAYYHDEMETGYNTVDWFHPEFELPVPPADIDKVRCIVRNIVRDWTEEGVSERAECYTPILKELEDWFPNRSQKRPPTCLVPGAGLGRLAFEISRLGFETQGNDFSYYMMICSSFILNGTQRPLEWAFYPWIHSNCNSFSDEHQLRAVRFPDLHPGSAGMTGGFSMCAGDFVEVYSHPDQVEAWDAVATCFFIDTAHNILEYLEIIARILKPGGVWLNLGPLLYHFADAHICSSEEDMSIELSVEDVKRIAAHYGLRVKKEKIINTSYSSNIKSMMQNRYYAAFWTMVKEKSELRTTCTC